MSYRSVEPDRGFGPLGKAVRRYLVKWSQPESNRRRLACKASALPSELWPLMYRTISYDRRSYLALLACAHTHK